MECQEYVYLADDVYCTHEDLVEVAVLHEVGVVDDGVLQAGPNLLLQLLVVQPQVLAQVVHAHHSQAVELKNTCCVSAFYYFIFQQAIIIRVYTYLPEKES